MDNDLGKISRAADRGDLSLFTEMHRCGFPLKDEDAISACKNGHLNILQYMYEHGYDLERHGSNLATTAAEEGHLPILQWLEKKNAIIYSRDWCLERAASRNHKKIVNWLLESWPEGRPPSARAQVACQWMHDACTNALNGMVTTAINDAVTAHRVTTTPPLTRRLLGKIGL